MSSKKRGTDFLEPNYGEEIVHIVPLGHEVDRAVAPFEKLKANRVYLIAMLQDGKYPKNMIDEQEYYLSLVKEKLAEKGIEVEIRDADMFEILDVMRVVSSLILHEKSRKNRVFVNMSAAGRLTSVGATLAAMLHGARVYYVVADAYSSNEQERKSHGLSICRRLRLKFLENFAFRLPDETSVKILVELCGRENGMKTDEIRKLLKEERVSGFEEDYATLDRGKKIISLQKLNKRFLEKLERDGYINITKKGRYSQISITESGRYVAYISGLME